MVQGPGASIEVEPLKDNDMAISLGFGSKGLPSAFFLIELLEKLFCIFRRRRVFQVSFV